MKNYYMYKGYWIITNGRWPFVSTYVDYHWSFLRSFTGFTQRGGQRRAERWIDRRMEMLYGVS